MATFRAVALSRSKWYGKFRFRARCPGVWIVPIHARLSPLGQRLPSVFQDTKDCAGIAFQA